MAEVHVARLVKAGIVLALCVFGPEVVAGYCLPSNSTCWPRPDKWEGLRKSLGGRLFAIDTSLYSTCNMKIKSKKAVRMADISERAHGICMHYGSCSHVGCSADAEWNLPEYSVEALTDADVIKTLAFANQHDIQVSVKSTGHNLAGSSSQAGSIMLWMHHFQKFGKVVVHSDSCGSAVKAIKLGGGQTWGDAYLVLQKKFNLPMGAVTVGSSGGWVMGGGLSPLAPQYGLGIDNVVQFEVILASGEKVVADRCSHPDLFWALRGSGGGFAVITSLHYRLNKLTPAVRFEMRMDMSHAATRKGGNETLRSYFHKWVDISGAGLDQRWGGWWHAATAPSGVGDANMWFFGSLKDAQSTLIKKLEAWRDNLPKAYRSLVHFQTTQWRDGYAAYMARNVVTWRRKHTGGAGNLDGGLLIPHALLKANGGAEAKALMDDLIKTGNTQWAAYLLGGAVSQAACFRMQIFVAHFTGIHITYP